MNDVSALVGEEVGESVAFDAGISSNNHPKPIKENIFNNNIIIIIFSNKKQNFNLEDE